MYTCTSTCIGHTDLYLHECPDGRCYFPPWLFFVSAFLVHQHSFVNISSLVEFPWPMEQGSLCRTMVQLHLLTNHYSFISSQFTSQPWLLLDNVSIKLGLVWDWKVGQTYRYQCLWHLPRATPVTTRCHAQCKRCPYKRFKWDIPDVQSRRSVVQHILQTSSLTWLLQARCFFHLTGNCHQLQKCCWWLACSGRTYSKVFFLLLVSSFWWYFLYALTLMTWALVRNDLHYAALRNYVTLLLAFGQSYVVEVR